MEIQDEQQQVGLQFACIQIKQLQAYADLMNVIIERRHGKRGSKAHDGLDTTLTGRGQSISS